MSLELIRRIQALEEELKRRPKRVEITTRSVTGALRQGWLENVSDIHRKEPEYTEVKIEADDGVYTFLSAEFTRTPKESIEIDVVSFVTGEVKFYKRADRYKKTTIPEQYKTDWVTWEKVHDQTTSIWFWWDGEDSFPVNISRGNDGQYFACVGQWGWNVSQMLKDMGGLWSPCICPKPERRGGIV